MALLTGLAGVVPAGALDVTRLQKVPVREWYYPGSPEPLDGVGGWIYVQPEPPPGPGQLSRTGYLYEHQFFFEAEHPGSRKGRIGLTSDASGPMVGMRLIDEANLAGSPPAVTMRYPWVPGRIYFVLVYGLGNGTWGGWVFDLNANAWTFFGTVQAPPGWGRLAPVSAFGIHGAQGAPLSSPFDEDPRNPAPSCAAFPRTEAWFFQPYGWRGPTILGPFESTDLFELGECPTQTGTANGWHYHGLGTAPSP